MLIAFMI